MRVLFLGSGPFGLPTLERLAAREDDLVVGTVPDAPRGRRGRPEPTVIKARALELGVPVSEVASLKGRRGPEFLSDIGGDLVITCDFRLILGRRFLEAPPRGCFNLHGSILPAHRGAAPVARGILAGDSEFGVSLYRMVLALDAGPVVDTVVHRPDRTVDTGELESELSSLAADLLERWLPDLKAGEVPLVEQDSAAATFAPKLEKHEGWIDWTADAETIDRKVRGLRPWPRAFTHWGDESATAERIFIDRAIAETEPAAASEPGSARSADAEGIRIACGDGTETLCILELQRAGKRTLPAVDFLRGFSFDAGRFLPPPSREPQPEGTGS